MCLRMAVLLAGCCSAASCLPATETGDDAAENRSANDISAFQCGGVGALTVRFLGPETIELESNSRSAVLRRERSASGERYVNDERVFWTKGGEALYIVNGVKSECVAL